MQATDPVQTLSLGDAHDAAYEAACGLISPTWPLDQLIAVNPFWELREKPAAEVAARIGALVRGHLLMDPEFYQQLKDAPPTERHLEAAAQELAAGTTPAVVETNGEAPAHWHNVSDLLDSHRDRDHEVAWRDEITHQISQFCADCFAPGGPFAGFAGNGPDHADAEGADTGETGSLYRQWLDSARHDVGIPILMGERRLGRQFKALPESAEELIAQATLELDVPDTAAELYAHALLLDINGWASWLAYLRWQARLQGGDSALMRDLLAIRMAWELVLWRHISAQDDQLARNLHYLWRQQLAAPERLLADHRAEQQNAWLWQRAAELAYQEQLAGKLAAAAAEAAAAPIKLQAVFCIDVRSELMRRHLEAQDPGVRTKGFAGFFGLPLEYRAAGTSFSRPQLPGLLAPAVEVTEEAERPVPGKLNQRTRWTELGDKPPAMFGLVEASGPLYAMKLFKDSFFPAPRRHPVNTLRTAQPLTLRRDGATLGIEERTELAATALHAMGLERDFAPVVMLVGHGSTSRNNPHAASLDCGACGGQTGELNSRALAELLNDRHVRAALAERGVEIPDETRFVAALHDTATDEIRTLESGVVLPAEVSDWLAAASAATRSERAAKLGVSGKKDAGVALERRSRDWSQVRPEWGLANNAAFIAASREQTRGLNLDGRVFLHDYDWREDGDGAVLELIMTAPMVVANWINMQYNASVTDNVRYGSGNKVLHNVVSGNLGVFEGNGGDLRIGLPMQSLHDGKRWMHTPLRLSVCLAAPQAAIQDVYERQAVVRDLVDNDWLFLFRLDDDGGLQRLYRDTWKPFSAGEAQS